MPSLVGLVVLVLVVYALVDCLRSPQGEVAALPRPAWLLVILLLPGIGALAWLLLGHRRGPSAPRAQPQRPVAPDDDPEFLWRLDQERRRGQEPTP